MTAFNDQASKSDTPSPLTGPALVGMSIVPAVLAVGLVWGGVQQAEPGAIIMSLLFAALSAWLYSLGLIRWALDGSTLSSHTSHMLQQNEHIIELLEQMAVGRHNTDDLELIRRLRRSNQMTDAEYIDARHRLFSDSESLSD